MAKTIKMYGLSTCSHCAKAKKFLESLGYPFTLIYVDRLAGDERNKRMSEVQGYNPNLTFPTIVIGENVIVGGNEEAIKEALAA